MTAAPCQGAKLVRFRHNDAADLDKRLSRMEDDGGGRLVVLEGIYSMLGDRAPLADFVEVKKKHGFQLLVDEAHSFGVLGPNGRGLADEAGLMDEADFIVGTFSKSIGAIGGFGASNHPMFETLRYASKPYMFTPSLAGLDCDGHGGCAGFWRVSRSAGRDCRPTLHGCSMV
jgi:8-amino-7-oxononanoate synthase